LFGKSCCAKGIRGTLLAGLATLVLAGCGGASHSASKTASGTTSSAPSTTTAASTTAGSTAPAASSVPGATPPGQALSVGASATLPYTPVSAPHGPGKFKLGVVVSAIEKGTLSDFNGVKLDATEKAATPVYVKVKITNLGDGDAGTPDNPSLNIEGIDNTGETQQSVTFLGEFPRCEGKEPPKPFTHGKSFETCLVFLVPGGITKVAYTGTEAYVESPVTWK
jgi:hypothetical protein